MWRLRLSLEQMAMVLSLAGVMLGVLTAVLGRMIGEDLSLHGYGIFVGCSIAAVVLGVLTRRSPLGRAAVITSSVLLLGSLTILA